MRPDVQRLVVQIKLTLPGLESARLDDEYEYASVPLYVIDAVFSIGVRYEAARQTVVKFCDAHGWVFRMYRKIMQINWSSKRATPLATNSRICLRLSWIT